MFFLNSFREQRVTLILISVMIGLSVFMTPILSFIPMPVLYGVFLYMGTSPLKDMQFYDRLLILFMPAKYQPDHSYLRKVISFVPLSFLFRSSCHYCFRPASNQQEQLTPSNSLTNQWHPIITSFDLMTFISIQIWRDYLDIQSIPMHLDTSF